MAQKKAITQQIKENPVVSLMSLVVLISASLTAYTNIGTMYTSRHTTADELAAALATHATQPHAASSKQIERNRRQSTCETLDLKISILNQQIWQTKQSDPNGQRLVDLNRDLKKANSKYDDLHCSEFA